VRTRGVRDPGLQEELEAVGHARGPGRGEAELAVDVAGQPEQERVDRRHEQAALERHIELAEADDQRHALRRRGVGELQAEGPIGLQQAVTLE